MTSPTPTDESSIPTVDPGTNEGSDQQAQLYNVLSEATGTTNDKDPAPVPPVRKPGQRGPDKKKRKSTGVSVDQVDDRSDPPLFTGDIPRPSQPAFEAVKPKMDRSMRRSAIAPLVKVVETGVVVFVESKVKARTSSQEIILKYSDASRPPAEVRELIIDGIVECWEEYFPEMEIGPWIKVVAGLGLWGKTVKDLIDSIEKLPIEQKLAA